MIPLIALWLAQEKSFGVAWSSDMNGRKWVRGPRNSVVSRGTVVMTRCSFSEEPGHGII